MSKPVDLTNCDREPIHIPGSVQDHGCLLACDMGLTIVLRHSVNAPAILSLPAVDMNGRALEDILGTYAVHEIRNALARCGSPSKPGLITSVRINDRSFDVAVHSFKGNGIIELERQGASDQISPLEISRELTSRLSRAVSEAELLRTATRLVRAYLSYDRVMIYRFAKDGSGEVVSEAKASNLESFLGQHFPASDIPQQARQLYLANTIRVISDSNGGRNEIIPTLDPAGEPLDLSYAHLRSVSPIHCEYLRNMGVAASMSVSIIVAGKLWGLIACHHYRTQHLSMAKRIAAEMLGEFFSLYLESVIHERRLQTALRTRKLLDQLLSDVSHDLDVRELLNGNLSKLASLMPCDGVGLWMNGSWSSHGIAPPASAIPVLVSFVKTVSDGNVWATDSLPEKLEAALEYVSDVAGVLSIPLSHLPRDFLLFFRREVSQTIEWGGDPDKSYPVEVHGERLTPRKSFAIWKEIVERKSIPWSQRNRDMAESTRTALVELILRNNELLADERGKAEVRQKMLNEELNHRVKNILALIKSLVSHSIDASKSLTDYVSSLKGRIHALAYAHDQVVRGDGGGSFAELLNAEVSPYREPSAALLFDGPPLDLDSRAFSVMALVLHELATNAAKYGALSIASGKLAVTWRKTQHDGCEIIWQESEGPLVTTPAHRGFGSVLMNRSIPYDLNGESTIEYAPSGVRARFLLPARYVDWSISTTSLQLDLKSEIFSEAEDSGGASLSGLKLLVVEDQWLIAIDAESLLMSRGAVSVELVATADQAFRRLLIFKPDAAVLDVNLGGETSLHVADELVKLQVPFIFATGYGDGASIPASLAGHPVIAKPYDALTLSAALLEAMSQR